MTLISRWDNTRIEGKAVNVDGQDVRPVIERTELPGQLPSFALSLQILAAAGSGVSRVLKVVPEEGSLIARYNRGQFSSQEYAQAAAERVLHYAKGGAGLPSGGERAECPGITLYISETPRPPRQET